MAKNWSDLCNFYSKVTFWLFLSKKINFTFVCFSNNVVKFSELNKRTLKICLKVTFPTDIDLYNLHSFLLWEKVKIFDFSKNND